MKYFTAGFVSAMAKEAKHATKPKVTAKPMPKRQAKVTAKPKPVPKSKVTAKPMPKAKAKARLKAKAKVRDALAPVKKDGPDFRELGRGARTLAGLYHKSAPMQQIEMKRGLTASLFNQMSATPEGSRIALTAINAPQRKKRGRR